MELINVVYPPFRDHCAYRRQHFVGIILLLIYIHAYTSECMNGRTHVQAIFFIISISFTTIDTVSLIHSITRALMTKITSRTCSVTPPTPSSSNHTKSFVGMCCARGRGNNTTITRVCISMKERKREGRGETG